MCSFRNVAAAIAERRMTPDRPDDLVNGPVSVTVVALFFVATSKKSGNQREAN
jgi:hypothetical protein